MSDEQKREEMCGFSAGATAEDSKLGIQRAVCGRDILGEGSGVAAWGWAAGGSPSMLCFHSDCHRSTRDSFYSHFIHG